MSVTPNSEPVPEHDYAALAEALSTLLAPLPKHNVRLVPEADWFSVLSQTDAKANAVLAQYCWPSAAQLLKLVLENPEPILAALRIARVVTAPTKEEKFAIGVGAAGGECNECGGLRGEWCEWALSRGSLAAIAKIASEPQTEPTDG